MRKRRDKYPWNPLPPNGDGKLPKPGDDSPFIMSRKPGSADGHRVSMVSKNRRMKRK